MNLQLDQEPQGFSAGGDKRAPISSPDVVAKLSSMAKEISPERASKLALDWIED